MRDATEFLVSRGGATCDGAFHSHYRGAIAESRRLKPSIPLFGENGVAIEDELVYEWSAENAA